jgi:hypothetical protein
MIEHVGKDPRLAWTLQYFLNTRPRHRNLRGLPRHTQGYSAFTHRPELSRDAGAFADENLKQGADGGGGRSLLLKSYSESWFERQRLFALVRLLRAKNESQPAGGIGDQPSLRTWTRRTFEELPRRCALLSRPSNHPAVYYACGQYENPKRQESARIGSLSVHTFDFTAAISLAASERPVHS